MFLSFYYGNHFQGQKKIAIVTFFCEYFSSYHDNKPVIDHRQLKKSHCKKKYQVKVYVSYP